VTKPLVIVESPTKVRTIKKYIGKDYNVAATVGHIKDLPVRDIGIDIEHDFTPRYQTIAGKQKVISELKRAAGDAADIYLAPDPDREGEAIAWHTAEVLQKKGREFHRVLFHELTGGAIREAMAHPQPLNAHKYDAQQARRILDRLVGYQVSPLLWRKVKGGLSAGRVQSVAVRIICERERAIQAFEPEEYWSITAELSPAGGPDARTDAPATFAAKLIKKGDTRVKIPDEAAARAILGELEGAAYTVAKVVQKTIRRNPLPPFITSKLQQEAIQKLRFSAKKTMIIAQQLYEGIDIGDGAPEGLITYMRTDSTRISEEAANEALSLIRQHFGPEYAIPRPRVFVNKNKAQDAHEAIRPTVVTNTPDKLARYLNDDQLSLYRLIWQRFIASQMAQAEIDQNTVTIAAGDYFFGASGSTIRFPGFMALYLSFEESGAREQEQQKTMLPPLRNGQALHLHTLVPRQHFTQPPPRFSEASLVKELEENGIGRPSTYATILSTIREKGYVEMTKGYFHPTELGFIVNDLLVANFSDIFGVHFTARLEDNLDRIEAAQVDSLAVLKEFYAQFSQELERAGENMRSMRGIGIPVGLPCPACGKGELHIKVGKNGAYLACDRYPACRFTCNYQRDEKGRVQPIQPAAETVSDKLCEKCGRPMLVKEGRFGPFLACSGYPECQHTASLNGSGGGIPTGVACPVPGCGGMLMERRSKRGKVFYGCSRYPDCDYAIWDKPVPIPCPRCGHPFLVEKHTKKDGVFLACPNPGCGYRQDLDKNPAD
jgi:DNA topoisomerase-1